jgi:preprotein translocase subunit YajC
VNGDVVANLLLLALPLVLLFLLFSRARRQQQTLLTAQHQAQPGARIITTAGLHATVVEVDGDVVVLETGPGQTSRWAVQAIGRVVEPAPETPASPERLADDDGEGTTRPVDGEA